MHALIRVAGLALSAVMTLTATTHAATLVYVSNAEDGNIGVYTLASDGSLRPGARIEAGKPVMPMSVSPDKRFLYAAIRSKPFTVITYAIDPGTGALKRLSAGPLAESFPYIRIDKTGRYLLGASYGGHLVSVNPVGADGKVSAPIQVIPTARNAHAIITDQSNRYVFVPHLGTDQVFQFRLDAQTGMLTANTPPLVQLKAGTGPRHIVMSPDNKFAYLLNELTATVTTLSLDAKTGLLTEVGSASALLPSLAISSSGGVLALGLIAAREFCEVYRLARAGRWDEARAIAARMLPADRGIAGRYGIGGLKAALDLQGLYGGPCRAPLATPDGDAIEDIKDVLATAGLL